MNKKNKVVSINQGRELMVIGYPETAFQTEYHYSTYDNQLYHRDHPNVLEYHEPRVIAPYIHDVIDWLREEFGFNVSLTYCSPMYPDTGWDGHIEWKEYNPNMKEEQCHGRYIFRKPENDSDAGLYDSPIDVLSVAINKCLKVLRTQREYIRK